jgi:hypothetical protein
MTRIAVLTGVAAISLLLPFNGRIFAQSTSTGQQGTGTGGAGARVGGLGGGDPTQLEVMFLQQFWLEEMLMENLFLQWMVGQELDASGSTGSSALDQFLADLIQEEVYLESLLFGTGQPSGGTGAPASGNNNGSSNSSAGRQSTTTGR